MQQELKIVREYGVDDIRITQLIEECKGLFKQLEQFSFANKVEAINRIREELHKQGPFNDEPVDFVQWVPEETVTANDYNPNAVAPPEMKLLEHSIYIDGYTQPIVGWPRDDKMIEVVDGFHRHRVGRESVVVNKRIQGYLPIVSIKKSQQQKNDRVAATIRHNRARGRHQVEAMSDIVVELKRRNWTNERISKELGMDQDEVLRLCQITGLADLFSDEDFSLAWDIEGHVEKDESFADLTDDFSEVEEFRKVSKNGKDRIFHTFDQWECYKAGFYDTVKEGHSKEQCEEIYREFLADLDEFETALSHVISEWRRSCEHYLTNETMNRVAWLGQASCCYARGIPSKFRSGFYLLTEEQQKVANEMALKYLNKWLERNGREPVTLEQGLSDSQAELY